MTKLISFYHVQNAIDGVEDLTFVWSAQGLCHVVFDGPAALNNDTYLHRNFGDFELVHANSKQVSAAKAWLKSYLAGGQPDVTDLRFDLRGSDFQRAVWKALQSIPRGKTASYGEIAKKVKRPKSSRAVGAACGANPIGLIIPCHRVIGSSGSLTGFAYGVEMKSALLDFEAGVQKLPHAKGMKKAA